jgi:hypothetical protein
MTREGTCCFNLGHPSTHPRSKCFFFLVKIGSNRFDLSWSHGQPHALHTRQQVPRAARFYPRATTAASDHAPRPSWDSAATMRSIMVWSEVGSLVLTGCSGAPPRCTWNSKIPYGPWLQSSAPTKAYTWRLELGFLGATPRSVPPWCAIPFLSSRIALLPRRWEEPGHATTRWTRGSDVNPYMYSEPKYAQINLVGIRQNRLSFIRVGYVARGSGESFAVERDKPSNLM